MKKTGKRILAAALAMISVFAPVSAAYAEEEEQNEFEAALQASYDIKPETNSIEGWPQGPQVYGNSAIVMDMDSGAVLYEKKADERHYPASITKILTALVALENSSPEDEVYFSEDSVAFMEYGDASIGMTPGEILSRKDAMYGMLLASANEVSYAIAESVGKLMGGDYNTFIQEMNNRAKELGCTGSNWVNANGLHDEQHYTTARDMALISSAVYQFDEFRTVTQTLEYTIGETNLMKETRTFQQNHKMLWPGNYYYYENCTGGKTGYTDQSRTTLVTMAESEGLRLVAVVLQDDGDVYVDTRAMFDYAYGNFSKVNLKDQAMPEEISSYTDESPYVVLPSGVEFSALEREITIDNEADRSGTVTYYYEGQNVGSAEVTLTEDYVNGVQGDGEAENGQSNGTAGESAADEAGISFGSSLLRVAVCAGAALLLVMVVFLIIARYRYLKRKKMKRAARRKRQAAARVQQQRAGGRQPESGSRPRPRPQQRRIPVQEEPRRRDRNGRYR